MITSIQDPMFTFIGKLIGNKNTTVTQNTTIHVQLYFISNINTFECTALKLITCPFITMLIAQILQFALSRLITHWTIQRVVDQKHLHNSFSSFNNIWRRYILYLHAIHNSCATRCHKFRHWPRVFLRSFRYFDQTGTTFPPRSL